MLDMDKTVKLSQVQIAAIERTLSKGDRVELIPVKDGVKAIKVTRQEIRYSPP